MIPVRKLPSLIFVLALLALCGLSDANAACTPRPNTGNSVFDCAHEGEARATATQYATANLVHICTQRGGGGPGQYGTSKKEANYWQPGYHCVSPATGSSLGTSYYSPIYYYAAACTAAPPLASGMFVLGSGSICQNGCEYASTGAGNITTTFFPGTPEEMQFQDRHGGNPPTGNTCDPNGTGPRPVTQETCKTVGTLTQCMRPDGKHCAQASTGKKFCWSPTEGGTKVSSNDGATKSPEGKPNNPPPIPPANNGNWEQTGSGTTTVNNNGNTTNYNTTTYQSSNGGTGDGGGATNPDGSEDGGDDDGPGSPGSGVGDLYDGNGDKTVGSVFNTFRSRVGASPIISAVDSFFTVNVGGACPVFTVPASDYWDSMTLDQHCSGGIAQSLSYIGWVLLAGAAIGAAIWALS